ncbi:hypothetical protein HCA61_07305 [Rhodococcus sp. HNM0563]|uniref:hypothetical protein n=1 Tax=Rhodococcus sp. HNM0563 TaxID=2716339 RepID=UPI00146A7452|nr:hypothetical protein [Rhodococcus sp. HNM0563]NLU62070.1 hypothetical protein [Rhodococcus sp. HNM0563]
MTEPDHSSVPGEFESQLERRERIAAQVRRWCEQCRIEGHHDPLSDDAAVAIASGYLDESARSVLAARRSLARRIPDIGGFGELRRLTEERERAAARAASQRPGLSRMVFEHRASEIDKRIRAARQSIVHSPAHYAQGVRAVRRERRDGIHLELDQREALFRALQRTPAPIPTTGVDRARDAVLTVASDRVGRWSDRAIVADVGRRAAEVLARQMPDEADRFVDRYDTLLFLAGALYDRIESSPAWHSEHLAVQRSQLNLTDELTQIATDVIALRGLLTELDDAISAAPAARSGLESRIAALGTVWEQLLDRVAALARIGDLLGFADGRMAMVEVAQRAASLDDRIDDLIGRSGARELSTHNTNFVGDQFGGAAESIGVLQSALLGDIAELTAKD